MGQGRWASNLSETLVRWTCSANMKALAWKLKKLECTQATKPKSTFQVKTRNFVKKLNIWWKSLGFELVRDIGKINLQCEYEGPRLNIKDAREHTTPKSVTDGNWRTERNAHYYSSRDALRRELTNATRLTTLSHHLHLNMVMGN